MSTGLVATDDIAAPYGGVRMTAEQFFRLPDDGQYYELVNGVVIVTPSPLPGHQWVSGELFGQLFIYLKRNPVGKVFQETDIHLGTSPSGEDLIYKPEVVYYSAARVSKMMRRLIGPPDLAVEVISPDSRRYDTQTKRDDYERCGVREYWIVDPQQKLLTFLRNEAGRFVEVPPQGDSFASEAVEGFVLNLAEVRDSFKPW